MVHGRCGSLILDSDFNGGGGGGGGGSGGVGGDDINKDEWICAVERACEKLENDRGGLVKCLVRRADVLSECSEG